MATKLVELFKNNSERCRQLDTLMRNCRNGQCRKIHVVAVGCGDAFITRYWPTLWQYVNQGLVILTVVDQEPLQSLAGKKIALARHMPDEGRAAKRLEKSYRDLALMVEQPTQSFVKSLKYVDLSDARERQWYEHIQADVAFILVPDDAHVQEARQWNSRATLVFIEKPYNRNLIEAEQFVDELEALARDSGNAAYTFFFGLDHYFAKIFDYVLKRGDRILEERIGQIQKIEYQITESQGVEPWRASTLEAGIVYDLLPHIIAMVSPIIRLETFPLVASRLEVKIARHKDCPFAAESYAWLQVADVQDYLGRRVAFSGSVAKGVGSEDSKYLRLIGEKGAVYFELNPNRDGFICLEREEQSYPLYAVKKGHPEILQTLLSGHFMEQPIGSITGHQAVQILQILTAIRQRIERVKARMAEYEVGWEEKSIREKATAG